MVQLFFVEFAAGVLEGVACAVTSVVSGGKRVQESFWEVFTFEPSENLKCAGESFCAFIFLSVAH